MLTPKAQQPPKAALVVRAVAKQPSNAAVVRPTASKAAIAMVARAKAAKKLMRLKSAAVVGPDPNAQMIEDAVVEEEDRGSNSNHGNVDAKIAAAIGRRAREQLHAAFQRTREEMDAAALAKQKRKLEGKKEETAAPQRPRGEERWSSRFQRKRPAKKRGSSRSQRKPLGKKRRRSGLQRKPRGKE